MEITVRPGRVSCSRAAMREPRPLKGIGDLLELQQRAVTAQVANMRAAPLRLGLQDVLVEGGPAIQRAGLVVGHQSRVSQDIGEHDHGMVTFSVPAGLVEPAAGCTSVSEFRIGASGVVDYCTIIAIGLGRLTGSGLRRVRRTAEEGSHG